MNSGRWELVGHVARMHSEITVRCYWKEVDKGTVWIKDVEID